MNGIAPAWGELQRREGEKGKEGRERRKRVQLPRLSSTRFRSLLLRSSQLTFVVAVHDDIDR